MQFACADRGASRLSLSLLEIPHYEHSVGPVARVPTTFGRPTPSQFFESRTVRAGPVRQGNPGLRLSAHKPAHQGDRGDGPAKVLPLVVLARRKECPLGNF